MVAANPVITRDEFDRIGARVAALEASGGKADPDAVAKGDEVAPRHVDFVRQEEFRLFKWLGTFALAAVLGGFGLLYEQTSDLRVAMERLHAELLREIHVQTADIREDMHALHTQTREDMHALHTQTRADITATREDMHAQHAAIRSEIARVRERVVRVETLDSAESP
ncbi:MAG: hypothetical protein OXK76_10940 [Gammaproteobacteria bacterium]|nr:hypothetical protein [Gammaproteobacteria bacterium]